MGITEHIIVTLNIIIGARSRIRSQKTRGQSNPT